MQLHIIGTSHIAKQSVEEIKTAFELYNPDIVAIELDKERATTLLSPHNAKRKPSIRITLKYGLTGYLFALIGQSAQKKLGQIVGMEPGEDMKTGLTLAKKHNKEIALIDQPIHITLTNISKGFGWREKGRFLADIAKGIVQPKKQAKELGIDFDLTKVPESELIEKMMTYLHKRYPSLHKAIIEDRNKYMVKRLVELIRKHTDKKILVIVGAGHVKGMKELLLKVEIIR